MTKIALRIEINLEKRNRITFDDSIFTIKVTMTYDFCQSIDFVVSVHLII